MSYYDRSFPYSSFFQIEARAHPATVPKTINLPTQQIAVMGLEKDTAMPTFTTPVDRDAPETSENVTPPVVTDTGTPTTVPTAAPAIAAPLRLALAES